MKGNRNLGKKFDHWRKSADKIGTTAPRTAKQARERKPGQAFASGDCQADPCNCTGCSGWD